MKPTCSPSLPSLTASPFPLNANNLHFRGKDLLKPFHIEL